MDEKLKHLFQKWMESFQTVDLFVKELLYVFLQRPIEVVPFKLVAKYFLETIASIGIPSDDLRPRWSLKDFFENWFLKQPISEKLWDELLEMGLEPLEDDQILVATVKAYFLQKLFLKHPWFFQAFDSKDYQLPGTLWRWLFEVGLEVHENDPLFWTAALEPVDPEEGYDFEEYKERLDSVLHNLRSLDSILASLEELIEDFAGFDFETLDPDSLTKSLFDPRSLANLVDQACRSDGRENLFPLLTIQAVPPHDSPGLLRFEDLKRDIEKLQKVLENKGLFTEEIRLVGNENRLDLLVSLKEAPSSGTTKNFH